MKILIGERIILRPWMLSDVEDVFAYARQKEVGPNAGWKPHQSLEESSYVVKRMINEPTVWPIVWKENNRVIGSIGLHVDEKRPHSSTRMLGYVLSKDYWGRGIMKEAVELVLSFAFKEMRLELVTVYHYPFNLRSRRVIENAGFQFEGVLRQASHLYNGRVYDDCSYSLTRDEYRKRIERRR